MGRALSTRSCTGQTHVGAASPRSTNQPHDDAMRRELSRAQGTTAPNNSTRWTSAIALLDEPIVKEHRL